MDKKIHIAFTENKLETYIKTPLVRGDKNAYKLIMDLSKYPDAEDVFIYAQRSDGKTFYDSFEVSDGKAEYVLKQNIYSSLGDVILRIVLKDADDTILTASILKFNVIEGAYSENMAENIGSLEEFLLSEHNKADKADTLAGYGIKDAYTKTEIDNKFVPIDELGEVDLRVSEIEKTALAKTFEATAKGKHIFVYDVSNSGKTAIAKVHGENMFAANKVKAISKENFTTYGNQIKLSAGENIYGVRINDLTFEVGKTYTFSFAEMTDHTVNTWGWRLLYQDGTYSRVSIANIFEITIEKPVQAVLLYVGMPYTGNRDIFITNINIRMAIDFAAVTVTANGENYTPDEKGEIEFPSASAITVETDTEGTELELFYTQDINKYKENVEKELAILKQAIIELGGTV